MKTIGKRNLFIPVSCIQIQNIKQPKYIGMYTVLASFMTGLCKPRAFFFFKKELSIFNTARLGRLKTVSFTVCFILGKN